MSVKKNSIAMLVLSCVGPFAYATPALTATTCNGSLGAIIVPGDLIVPAGRTCRLSGTEVDGKVIVETGARLFTSNNTIIDDGGIVAGSNASVELVQTRSDGLIEVTDSRQLTIRNSSLDAGIKSTNTANITLSDTIINGNVEVNQRTNLTVRRVETTSGFKTLNINSFNLFRSTLADVIAEGTASRTEFCGNTLTGSALFARNAGVLQVGGAGVSLSCTSDGSRTNTVGGNLEVLLNIANSVVANNRVTGNLTCFNNSPSPTGGNNIVTGNKEGQCTAL